jgi:hypothetical protein
LNPYEQLAELIGAGEAQRRIDALRRYTVPGISVDEQVRRLVEEHRNRLRVAAIKAAAPKPKRNDNVFWAPNEIFDEGRLSAHGILVFLCLARHADADGFACPGSRRIARECRIARRNVEPALDELFVQRMIEPGKKGARNQVGVKILDRSVWVPLPDPTGSDV